MKTSILTSAFLMSVLTLTACSKTHLGEAAVEGDTTFSDAIVGGTAVTPYEDAAKTTVQIYSVQTYRDQLGRVGISGVSTCTGSIIAKDIILTAAHCTTENPNYMFLYFSSEAPKSMREFLTSVTTNPMVRRVAAGQVGANWPKVTGEQVADWGDIALLKFQGGLPTGYKLARLLPVNAQLKAQQPLTLAGFGITDGIKQTPTDKLLKVNVSVLDPAFSATEMIIDSGDGRGPCHGDSGGPAYVTVNGRQYVAGTTSRADIKTDPRGLCIGDTVYTKVQPYTKWIKETMKLMQAPNFKAGLIPQPRG